MESAGLPCEKKGCLGFNWTILRPRPEWARNASTSNGVFFRSTICILRSRWDFLGTIVPRPTESEERHLENSRIVIPLAGVIGGPVLPEALRSLATLP